MTRCTSLRTFFASDHSFEFFQLLTKDILPLLVGCRKPSKWDELPTSTAEFFHLRWWNFSVAGLIDRRVKQESVLQSWEPDVVTISRPHQKISFQYCKEQTKQHFPFRRPESCSSLFRPCSFLLLKSVKRSFLWANFPKVEQCKVGWTLNDQIQVSQLGVLFDSPFAFY